MVIEGRRSDAELRGVIRDELRPMRIRFWFVIVAVVIGSALGVWLIQRTSNNDAARALALQRRIAAQQHDFQVDSHTRCIQGNLSRAGTRTVFTEILNLSTQGTHTPEERAAIMRFLAKTRHIIGTRIPNVDCGPAP